MQNQLSKSRKTCTFSRFFWKSIEKVQVFLLFGSWFCIYGVFHKLKWALSWNPHFFLFLGESLQLRRGVLSWPVRQPAQGPVSWSGSPESKSDGQAVQCPSLAPEDAPGLGDWLNPYILTVREYPTIFLCCLCCMHANEFTSNIIKKVWSSMTLSVVK